MTARGSTSIVASRRDLGSRRCASGHGSSAARAGSTVARGSGHPSVWPCPSRRGRTTVPETESAIRLLVVDDHQMVREGLRSMLSGEAIDIVGEAASGSEAVRGVAELSPEVVLLDLALPDVD